MHTVSLTQAHIEQPASWPGIQTCMTTALRACGLCFIPKPAQLVSLATQENTVLTRLCAGLAAYLGAFPRASRCLHTVSTSLPNLTWKLSQVTRCRFSLLYACTTSATLHSCRRNRLCGLSALWDEEEYNFHNSQSADAIVCCSTV